MKNILLLTFSILFFSACSYPQSSETSNFPEQKEDMKISTDDHIGCQEGEIINGKCTVAEDGKKNTDLFENIDFLNVLGKEVVYAENIHGYLAEPEEEGVYPAVVMIHEWWGLNDNIRDMVRLLASEGYVVLAVDLYNGEVAETSEQAGELTSGVRENTEQAVANMRSAISYLRTLPNVEQEKIASLGWCFGGQQSLNLALASDDLSATVIYYGQLTDDTEQLQKIHWPVMGVFGSEDTNISVESVNAFSDALNALSIPSEIYMYKGVGHAFANPSGGSYAPQETLDAWQKTIAFLGKNLKGESK